MNNDDLLTHNSMKQSKDYTLNILESEEKYRALFNNATDAIFLYELVNDSDIVRVVEVNDTACKRLGYSRKELLGMHPANLDGLGLKSNNKNISNILEKGHHRFEATNITKAGRIIPVEINVHHFKMSGRRMMLSISRDIAERKCAERDAKKNQVKYHSLFKNMDSGFAYCKVILDDWNIPMDFEYIVL